VILTASNTAFADVNLDAKLICVVTASTDSNVRVSAVSSDVGITLNGVAQSSGLIPLRNPDGKDANIFIYEPLDIYVRPSGGVYLATNSNSPGEFSGFIHIGEGEPRKLILSTVLSRNIRLVDKGGKRTLLQNPVAQYTLICSVL
jgi:hypothetical protein